MYEIASLAECLRRGWLLHWLRAFISLLRHLHVLLERRAGIQSRRRVGDQSILCAASLPFSAGFIKTGFESKLASMLNQVLNTYWGLIRQWI